MKLFGKTIMAALALIAVGCADSGKQSATVAEDKTADTMLFVSTVNVDTTEFLIMRMNPESAYPALVDSVIPSVNDSTIALCVEAAFTGELLEAFTPSNIAGDYVTGGRLRRGYPCKDINGYMYADKNQVIIASDKDVEARIDQAVKNQGMLFQQILIVADGKNVYRDFPIKSHTPNIYRSACVMTDGAFAVIQSKNSLPLGDFIASLITLGVSDALYLDMGRGWNYGWYRPTESSQATFLFDYRTPYQTNWLLLRHR